MPRTRTTKKLAQRIDLNYFKRATPLRRWRTWLVMGIPALAVVWLVSLAVRRDDTVYSSGRLSSAHAFLNSDCAACHVREAGRFKAAAADAACLACHDGPIHHEGQMFTPTCASCHLDHRGPLRLAATNDDVCIKCHGDLRSRSGIPKIETRVSSFTDRHPEFAALRQKQSDPGTIKLNHSVHLKKGLRGPNGKPVQLICNDCHRANQAREPWPYGSEEFRLGGSAWRSTEPAPPATAVPHKVFSGAGQHMAPVNYEKACAGCHLLQFDKRFQEGLPHGKQAPEIRKILVKKFSDYIRAHPGELRVVREPDRNVTGRPLLPVVRTLTPSQWIEERTAEAEQLLWRKTCKQCHALTFPSTGIALSPDGGAQRGAVVIEEAKTRIRWMPHARFSHAAHQMLTCTSCHAATTSTETSDVLMPGIATCRSCHNQSANGAESRCFLCHTYHDWSREKPVRGKFRLRNAGQPPQPGEQKVAVE